MTDPHYMNPYDLTEVACAFKNRSSYSSVLMWQSRAHLSEEKVKRLIALCDRAAEEIDRVLNNANNVIEDRDALVRVSEWLHMKVVP